MKFFHKICFFGVIIFLTGSVTNSSRAGVILQIDLSVVNQVTFTATSAASMATVSGNDETGVYLKDLLGSNVFSTGDMQTLPGADLVYFNDLSDGSPTPYRANTSDPGLNLYSLTGDSVSPAFFAAGVQAFKGSVTWTLTADGYAVLLQAPATGDIYAFADSIDDLNGGPQMIGQYSSVLPTSSVPEPTSAAIALTLLGGCALRRYRKMRQA